MNWRNIDWRAVATLAGGAGLFAIVVGLGAAIIVSTTPRPEIQSGPKDAILMENARLANSSAVPVLVESPRTPPAASPSPPVEVTDVPSMDASPPPAAPVQTPRTKSVVQREYAALPPPPTPPRAAAAAPPAPQQIPHSSSLRPKQDPRYDGILTSFEIRRIKASLRLTPEQGVYWPPVEALLAEIGARQMALVNAGQKASEAVDSGTSMKIYWTARPLLGVLREDQKEKIRIRARAMGFEAVASGI